MIARIWFSSRDENPWFCANVTGSSQNLHKPDATLVGCSVVFGGNFW
jgi:hypothetical protein